MSTFLSTFADEAIAGTNDVDNDGTGHKKRVSFILVRDT